MFRGTTPTFTFSLPIDTDQIAEAWITIKQANILINKTLADCEVAETSLSVTLSQEETLSLSSGFQTCIQLRVLLNSSTALATPIYTVDTQQILKDGVIE